MLKFDHLAIVVSNLDASRAWYVEKLGLQVEFEIAERRSVALQDSEGFAIFLVEGALGEPASRPALWFQVEDVHTSSAGLLGKGVSFVHAPQKIFWGYGAEIVDPDGYPIRLWDAVSMKEQSES